MSRVIVKNIPNGITEAKLRDHFSRCGIVTDIQLKYTPEGKFRNFGFIGYESEEHAGKAIQHFNNTFLRTSKLSVAPCVSLHEAKELKTWSKYSQKPPADVAKNKDVNKEKKKPETAEEILKSHKKDPLFQEFVKVQGKAGSSVWENKLNPKEDDDDEQDESSSGEVEEHDDQDLKEDKPSITVPKKLKFTNLFVAKIHNIPSKTKRQDLFRFFKPIKPCSIRIPPKQKGFAYIGYKTESDLKKALLKDKSFLGGKQVKVVDFTAKDRLKGEDESNQGKKISPKWIRQKESVDSESIIESGKLFYRNLAYSVKEEDLKKLFEKYGPVAEIDVPIDTNTRKLKGFGTVTFLMPEHAVLAFNELNGTFFQGRMFHILPAKVSEKDKNEEDEAGLNFKQKKELKLKKMAQSSHNWNTLFMGENAIAEVVAKKYGKTKEEVLTTDLGTTSAAVRLALGETEIVMEMQKFLEDNGIQLDAFNEVAKKRSNTVILVKNLPPGTEVSELTERFSKFGLLGRVILPPSGITAVVEFSDPSEAKKAFKKLAYTRFKSLPLYLEWAPDNTFATLSNKETNTKTVDEVSIDRVIQKDKNKTDNEAKLSTKTIKLNHPPVEEPTELGPEEGTTLFLKNLSFQTTEDVIKQTFESVGPIHSVQVVRRKNGDKNESRGYGFIQFKLRKTADVVLKNMATIMIDGRRIEISRSDRTLNSEVTSGRKAANITKQTGTKILVRNVPFQANAKEIRDLFSVFGELKTLRLPRKLVAGADESHRGFCFVDFLVEDDAKKAFGALCKSTHLYGRRLVLEWAEADDDGIEQLRKRTAEKFGGTSGGSDDHKRSRKAVFDSSQIAMASESAIANDEGLEDDEGDDDF
ncbi:probable RNA-binding protein 19 [Uranotaenia lowii]|uniref:probable RNA-binding protein 19 n=1 Tax=Uranotaenia lowii TaxID=190385 RepID=UPI00247A084D|nr:probable RNA-binding protein 19 [Uranotaenia lowii]XP_055599278.1 probable RNA-binding protein 19 [Uranotaenia lowii]